MSNGTRIPAPTEPARTNRTAEPGSDGLGAKASPSPEQAEGKKRWFAAAAVRGACSGAARSVVDWLIRVFSH